MADGRLLPEAPCSIDIFIEFLKILTHYDRMHSEPVFCYQAFGDTVKKNVTSYTFCIFDPEIDEFKQAFDFLEKYNHNQYGAHVAINELGAKGDFSRGRKESAVTRVRGQVVEIDKAYLPKNTIKQLIEILRPTYVTASSSANIGSKQAPVMGFKTHWYFLYEGLPPLDKQYYDWEYTPLTPFEQQIYVNHDLIHRALCYKIDNIINKIHSNVEKTEYTDKVGNVYPRTIRVPGFYHQKDPKNPWLVQPLYHDNTRYFSEDILTQLFDKLKIDEEFLKLLKKKNSVKLNIKSEDGYPLASIPKISTKDISNTLISRYDGSQLGNRNEALFKYCVHLFSVRKFVKNEVLGAALIENECNNKPPLDQDEVVSIVDSALQTYLESADLELERRAMRGEDLAIGELFTKAYKEKPQKDNSDKDASTSNKYKYDISDKTIFASFISDTSIVERFTQKTGSKYITHPSQGLLCFNPDTGAWETNPGELEKDLHKVLSALAEEDIVQAQFIDPKGRIDTDKLKNFIKGIYSVPMKDRFYEAIEKRPAYLKDIEEFDSHYNLLNCKNGVVDLTTGKLIEHDASLLMTKQTKANINPQYLEQWESIYEYEQQAELCQSSLFTKFVWEICCGDLELYDYLQKMLGYSLFGGNEHQLLFFLHGTGNNGKSLLLEVVKKVLGDYCSEVEPEILMLERNDLVTKSTLATMPGVRLVITTETDENKAWDEATIKRITGQREITAKLYHKDPFKFNTQFNIVCMGNHRPTIKGTDFGIWRRLVELPFDLTVKQENIDTKLLYKITKTHQQLDEILSWLVAGAVRYSKYGLKTPNCVQQAITDYKESMNPVSSFIEECFDEITLEELEILVAKNSPLVITATKALSFYNLWRKTGNGEKIENSIQMGRKLSGMGLKSYRIHSDGQYSRFYPIVVKDLWAVKFASEKKNNVHLLFGS